ncbi:hypothetical protein K437DRAFT_256499 [Tilletiaria anomala UBC 951]|uniref:LsmAD domain-containing protein n=1 Tax=Tilletiaria anomala (strain ATCC 24038 / CBS 436.72 / UBC 951) TaxID=1037660 RepID=A0A066W3B2_TILAU|nr:uncharacterized protein K437DRAFT_256499 [Tilletiaria anomala UBC 951]KDN45579.1 hypothetical protein K437DRAFT_256499 [Tilletiaria anomala UBC 951]
MSSSSAAGRGRSAGPAPKRQSYGGGQSHGLGAAPTGGSTGKPYTAAQQQARWDPAAQHAGGGQSGPREIAASSGSGYNLPAKKQSSTVVNGTGPPSSPASTTSYADPQIDELMRTRMAMLTVALIGCQVIVKTADCKYVGILAAVMTDAGDLGVLLSQAYRLKDSAQPEGPLQSLLIPGRDVSELEATDVKFGPSVREDRQARSDFRTDVEISASRIADGGAGRSLQKWSDDGNVPDLGPGAGLSAAGGRWDQFATNEAKFGLKTDYNEELYTTKLDKSGVDFAVREKEAARLAAEIMSTATNDAHLAEERGQKDDSGLNEEDKYGAVQRSPNAYVPPARRLSSQGASGRTNLAAVSQAAIARSSGENGAAVRGAAATAPVSKKDKSMVYDEFNRFVQKEQSRAAALQHQQAKKEKDQRLAELKNWGSTFKLKSPAPADIPGIAPHKQAADDSTTGSLSSSTPSSGQASAPCRLPKIDEASPFKTPEEAKSSLAKMTIPKIPPFNPDKSRASASSNDTTQNPPASDQGREKAPAASAASSSNAPRLSAKASAFKPFNPSAAVFKPGPSQPAQTVPPVQLATVSSGPSTLEEPQTLARGSNPFFGLREPKRPVGGAPVNVFSEFSPVRTPRKSDPTMIGPLWPFSGRPFRQIFAPAASTPAAFLPPPLTSAEVPAAKSPVPASAQVASGGPMQNQPFIMSSAGGAGPAPYGFAYPPMGAPYRFPQGPAPGQPFPAAHGMPPMSMAAPYFAPTPFSPPMPPHGPAGGYSPHLSNVPASGPAPIFVVGGGLPPGGPGNTLQRPNSSAHPVPSHMKGGPQGFNANLVLPQGQAAVPTSQSPRSGQATVEEPS